MEEKATLQVIPFILRLARDHRHPLTPAEAKIWARVRNRGLGFKIRRQHPIWRVIADFYCAEAKLVIKLTAIHIQSLIKKNTMEQEPNGWKTEVIKSFALQMKTSTDIWKLRSMKYS